jgi:hypothetical protein
MSVRFSGWRIAGAFGAPFVVLSIFLVLAESVRSTWPSAFGEIQELGLLVGTIAGFLCLPRLSLVQRILIGIPYFVGMVVVLFWFALFFVGAVYGDAL